MLGILARQIGIKSNHNTVSAFHDEARAKIWQSHRRGHKAKLAIGPYIIDYDHVSFFPIIWPQNKNHQF